MRDFVSLDICFGGLWAGDVAAQVLKHSGKKQHTYNAGRYAYTCEPNNNSPTAKHPMMMASCLNIYLILTIPKNACKSTEK